MHRGCVYIYMRLLYTWPLMCVSILSKCNGSLVHAVHACMHRWPLVMSRPHTRGVPQVRMQAATVVGETQRPRHAKHSLDYGMTNAWTVKFAGLAPMRTVRMVVYKFGCDMHDCTYLQLFANMHLRVRMYMCIHTTHTTCTLTQACTETYNTHTRTHNMCTHAHTHNTCTSTYVHTTVVYLASTPSTRVDVIHAVLTCTANRTIPACGILYACIELYADVMNPLCIHI